MTPRALAWLSRDALRTRFSPVLPSEATVDCGPEEARGK
jgi:hypothetical protein